MSKYYGDFLVSKTVRCRFNTVNATGVPTSLSSGAVTVTKDGADVTPSGGVTLATDVGSVTGRNHVVIDMSVDTTTFTAGSEYSVRLSGSSAVGGTSVVGIVVGEWSVENRSVTVDANGRVLLQPTQTGVTIPTVTAVTNIVPANVTQWTGNAVAATRVSGVPIVDIGYVLGVAAAISNGTAQAGTSTSITLASSEPATVNFYVGRQVTIVSGTATGQARFVTAYNGSTKVATVHRAWDVIPDATSQYTIDSLIEIDAYQFAGQNVVLDANNLPSVNAKDWNGTAISTSVPNTASVTVTAISAGIAAADVWGAARTSYAATGTFGQAVAGVSSSVTVGGYAVGQDPGTYILGTTANKLATDSTGRVLLQPTQAGVTIPNVTTVGSVTNTVTANVAGNVTVGGYAVGQDPGTYVLMTAANKLATDSSGRTILQPTQAGVTIPTVTTVTTANLNLSQAVPTSNTSQTVGDALNAARAQGFGKWQLVGTTLTLYAPDGTTAVRTFSLDSVSAPTVRT